MAASWSKTRKLIIGAIGLAVVAGMIAFNLQKENNAKSPTRDIETVPVRRGAVVEQLKETGRIEFVRTVEVKSTVSGEIVHLFAEPGQAVSAGDMLAIIRPDPNQTLQLYNKRAAVERVRIDLEQVRKDLARKEALKKQNLIAEEEIERIRDQLEKTQNAYQLARLELETLETRSNIQQSKGHSSKAQLDNVRVLAPASGIVIARPVEIGEVVVSGILSTVTGTKLFEIGDPSLMMVKSHISEVDEAGSRRGRPFTLSSMRIQIRRIAARCIASRPWGKFGRAATSSRLKPKSEFWIGNRGCVRGCRAMSISCLPGAIPRSICHSRPCMNNLKPMREQATKRAREGDSWFLHNETPLPNARSEWG